MTIELANHLLVERFRGFCPIVVDVETGGVDPQQDALLELAAFAIDCTIDKKLIVSESVHYHITPFPGTRIQTASLAINGIDPDHPFRFAITEQIAISNFFNFLKDRQRQAKCKRCVLVGHNAWFDLNFILAAVKRCNLEKKNPLHSFTSFDTATLAGVVYGQTVLSKALEFAKIDFNTQQSHSAVYDAQKTAELFCNIVNQWPWPK